MITKLQYVEYLISTVGNFTGMHLAEHLDDVSHDSVTDYLQSAHLTACNLWALVSGLLTDSEQAFLIGDDSVQDNPVPHLAKRASHRTNATRASSNWSNANIVAPNMAWCVAAAL